MRVDWKQVWGKYSFETSAEERYEIESLVEEQLKGASPKHNQFIATYVKAFQAKFGENTRPELSGKEIGQIKTLIKTRTLERACDLIQVYLLMDDPWFQKKCYDFSTFMANIQKVSLALDTGRQSISGGTDIAKILESGK